MELKGNLADSLKLISFQIVYYLVRCIPSRPKTKHLLIVKTDEIGDYVLVRNFLGKFRAAGGYHGYKICLVANSIWKSIYVTYDADVADEVIWLDKAKFRRDLRYRWRILRQIRLAGFSDAVNLVYSRSFRYDDLLVAVSTSGNNIGMQTVDLPRSKFERLLTPRKIYHHQLYCGDDTLFDALRNARFIESLTGTPIHPVSTAIPLAAASENGSQSVQFPPAKKYFVVFPGSGQKAKKWPADNFAAVARHITLRYGIAPVVGGSGGDKPDCDEFIEAWEKATAGDALPAGQQLIDYTGKTSLPQFLVLLSGAVCTISVDTGTVHLAAAVQCPVFALFSGLHYGRFAPYPPEIASRFYPVYPDSTDAKIADGSIEDNAGIPLDLVKTIPAQKLINKINAFLTV